MSLTDLELFRLKLGDFDPSSPLFTDDEAQEFLDENPGNILLAVADGLDALANRYALQADVTLTSGDDTVARKLGAISAGYSQRAESVRKRAIADTAIPWHGGGSLARKEALRDDPDRVQPRFYRGQFHNHRS